jgi:DnaK suppressor protein
MNAKQADVLVPFGATGDLAFKKIHPAIHKLGPSVVEKKTMTKAEIDHYQRRLLFLKRRLGGDLSELEEEALRPVGGEPSGALSNVPGHLAELASDEYEEEVNLGLLENEAELLEEVNDALDRIERGTFGRCENCGRDISRERLEALPYARYCMRCARQLQAGAG